jgi:hypothetical protein
MNLPLGADVELAVGEDVRSATPSVFVQSSLPSARLNAPRMPLLSIVEPLAIHHRRRHVGRNPRGPT